jgi:hypothetical protein
VTTTALENNAATAISLTRQDAGSSSVIKETLASTEMQLLSATSLLSTPESITDGVPASSASPTTGTSFQASSSQVTEKIADLKTTLTSTTTRVTTLTTTSQYTLKTTSTMTSTSPTSTTSTTTTTTPTTTTVFKYKVNQYININMAF